MENQFNNQHQQHHHKIDSVFLDYRKKLSFMNDEQQNIKNHLTIDSAYESGYNLTSNSNVTSDCSNETSTPHRDSLKNNHDYLLESAKLTPVSQNINKICNFHITTPKSNEFLPLINNNNENCLKRSSAELIGDIDHFQSTPKKIKKIYATLKDNFKVQSTNTTPNKLKHQHKNEKRNFRQKLRSAPDLDAYFDENLFSPQKEIINAINRLPLVNANCYYQSSTPNPAVFNNLNANEIVKFDSIKELTNCSNEEFNKLLKSDEKIKIRNKDEFEFNDFYMDTSLRELMKQKKVDLKLKNNKPTNTTKTPFRRVLSFTNDLDFESPKSSNINNCPPTNKTTSHADGFYVEHSFQHYKHQYKTVNTILSDRTIAKKRAQQARFADIENSFKSPEPKKKFTENDILLDSRTRIKSSNSDMLISPKEQTKTPINISLNSSEMLITPTEIQINSSDMELTPSINKKKFDNFDLMPIECENNNLDNFWMLTETPPKRKVSFENDEKIQLQQNKQLTRILPNTPKKLKNSLTSSQIDCEKFEILYPTIPITPRKKLLNQSPKKKSQQQQQQPIKINSQKTKFYDGALHLNIIAKLEPYPIVLDQIFDYLNSRDLLNLTMVTKIHRKIIKENFKTNRRLNKFLKEFQISKENFGIKKCNEKLLKKLPSETSIQIKKIPFTLNNIKFDRKRSLEMTQSPPVSPSKKKFYANQKVVNILSDTQSIIKCPRCAKASQIINTPAQEKIHHINKLTKNINQQKKNSSQKIFNHPLQSKLFTKSLDYHDGFDDDDDDNDYFNTEINYNIHNKSKLMKSLSVDTGLLQKNDLERQRQQYNDEKFQPFGKCMTHGCEFKFCLDCTCEYHPGNKCKIAPNSPSKEDIQNGILQLVNSPYSKQQISVNGKNSKMMRRKSLKRLCF